MSHGLQRPHDTVPARSNCHDDSPIMQLPQIRSHRISQFMLRIEQCTIEVQCNHSIFYAEGSHFQEVKGERRGGKQKIRRIPPKTQHLLYLFLMLLCRIIPARLAMASMIPHASYHASCSFLKHQSSHQSTHAFDVINHSQAMRFRQKYHHLSHLPLY